MTADRTAREGLEAAERFQRLSAPVVQWTWSPSRHEVTLRLPPESEYAASRELMQAALDLSRAGPLSDFLAAAEARAERMEAERDEVRAEAYALKLAAAGGEDVPGSAALVTADDVKRWREEDAAQIVAAEIGRERAVLAFTVYVESGHGGAMHEAVQWLRAGARGPVPYPDGACFRAWADQNSIGNRDGFLTRTDQPEGTGSPAAAQEGETR